jgi:hypothetical protein
MVERDAPPKKLSTIDSTLTEQQNKSKLLVHF